MTKKTDVALVADIGGTNARFAIVGEKGGVLSVSDAHAFRAEDFESIGDAANAYLEAAAVRAKAACFAVAGPITDEVVEFTNSPWVLDIKAIKPALGLERLVVANDFEALAHGVSHLDEDDFVSVKAGAGDPSTPVLVIGPGTGLGQALIVPSGSGERIISTEGGHVAFAPRSDLEIDVMKFVAREHPRVSIERILSGRGLVNIHRALCARAGTPRASLQANEITAAALTKEYPIAVEAVDLFCGFLGAAVGDAVLATGARGGVVLGGGILPKIRDVFLKSTFVERFLDKGRMRDYVEDVPIRLIVGENAALLGAASILQRRS